MSVCADMNQLSDWLTVWTDTTDMSVICDGHWDASGRRLAGDWR